MTRKLWRPLAIMAAVLGLAGSAIAQDDTPGVPEQIQQREAAALDIGMSAQQMQQALQPPGALLGNEKALTRAIALYESLADDAHVRVIVRLNLGWLPDAALEQLSGASAVSAQRQAIASAGASVLAQMVDAQAVRSYDSLPLLAMTLSKPELVQLAQHPDVAEISRDELSAPSLREAVPQVGGDRAWGKGIDGTGTVVAILDTGVSKAHEFIGAQRVVAEACFSTTESYYSSRSLCPGGGSQLIGSGAGEPYTSGVCNASRGDCDHGTHVAGIVSGANGQGLKGMAPGAKLMGVQVFSRFAGASNCDGEPECVLSYTSDQIAALEWLASVSPGGKYGGLTVAAANMSLGGGSYAGSCDSSNAAIKLAIDQLRSRGIATVIASGNDSYRTTISAPACISSAVSVGSVCDSAGSWACTGVDAVASYSNINSLVDLLAPGSVITSAVPGGGNNRYEGWNGTSMATPMVAGAWALMKQRNPSQSVTDTLAELRANAKTINDTRPMGTVRGLKRIDLAFLNAGGGGTPPPMTDGIILTKDGSGAGTVTSSPGGIICGPLCQKTFPRGTRVLLIAQPSAGSVFAGWSGPQAGLCLGSTEIRCSLTVNGAMNVTATFNSTSGIAQHRLSVSRSGTGAGDVSSSPAGINCGSTCAANFNANTNVTLTATPATGSVFSSWSGACSGSANTCQVRMDQAKSVTALFSTASFGPQPLSVTIAADRGARGRVQTEPAGLDCSGGTCTSYFNQGANVQVVAVPPFGAAFTHWSGDSTCAGSTNARCTVNMNMPRSLTAHFDLAAAVQPSITVSKTGRGSGTIASTPNYINCGSLCSRAIAQGTQVTLYAVAASGSRFVRWGGADAGACSGSSATSCKVTVNGQMQITAQFD